MEFTQADNDIIQKEFEELRLASVKRCASQEEYDGVEKAFKFANSAHNGVKRRSGEPYILHPIAVAKIVVQEIGLGYKSIAAALLHDVVEDTDYTVDDIKRHFGDKIASLVDGLTKIKAAMETTDGGTIQAENFKRILLTLNDDVRVVLIKLADRLHNIRTIEFMPDYKRDKILSETMYIFIPLAQRLGLYSIKSEMENIWLKFREPEAYNSIQEKLDNIIKEKAAAIDDFMTPIADYLKSKNYQFQIYKRTKTPYSIWKKMKSKGLNFGEIYDIYAVRIIFTPKDTTYDDERAQCYKIYLKISSLYSSKTDRLRDWITAPKSNGYEALHCTIMSPLGNWVEIQIRTERMNAIAEKGIAAHWRYKKIGENKESELDRWLDMVKDVISNPDVNALEFLDNFHDTVLDKEIYVFTPKGESKSLKKGATVLDFAYSIHTQIGNKAIAGKVNLKLVPLSRILKNGDQVEIITAESQKPQRDWLDFLKTSKAKNLVYEALKEMKGGDPISQGRAILEKELAKLNVKLSNKVLKKIFEAYSLTNKDELYSKIHAGLVNLLELDKIIKQNAPNKNVLFYSLQFLNPFTDKVKEEKEVTAKEVISKLGKNREYLLGEDIKTNKLNYRTAECCHPIPGDNIVAFVDDNGDIIIHKKSCTIANELASVKGEKIVNAKWNKHMMLSSLARVKIIGVDRMGLLNDVTTHTTQELNINLRKILLQSHDNVFEGYMDCYVHNTDDLEKLMKRLRSIKSIESVTRIDITD